MDWTVLLSVTGTLAAVGVGALLNRLNDHRRWLRDQKIAVYREAAEAIYAAIGTTYPMSEVRDGSAAIKAQARHKELIAAHWRLQLVCSEQVNSYLVAVVNHAEWAYREIKALCDYAQMSPEQRERDGRGSYRDTTPDTLQDSLDLCIAAMRKDLGVSLFEWKAEGKSPIS